MSLKDQEETVYAHVLQGMATPVPSEVLEADSFSPNALI